MRLSRTHGYVGMYVVNKDYRGLGIGKQVWNAAINHLGPRNNGLSAVAHLFTLYRDKAGFSHVADWTVDLYKLDNLTVNFLCQQKARQNYKRGRVHNFKFNHTLYEYYNESDDLMLSLHGNNNAVAFLNKECDFCDLVPEYAERQYCIQRKASKNIDFSDDESFGFSSLFFEEQNNAEVDILTEEVINQENDTNKETEMIEVTNDPFECCIQYYCNSYHCNNGKLRTVLIKQDSQGMMEDVVNYDRRLHQYDRSQIVQLTLKEKDCISRVAMLGEAVVGYGCIKPNLQKMWIVSPLYADNEYVAQLLMLDLVSDLIFFTQLNIHPGIEPSIVLKAPSNNHHASRLLKSIGFVKQDYSLRRCYTKNIFEVPTQSIYALHTSVFCTE